MKYIKPEASNIRGICVRCGKNPQKKKPNNRFFALCSSCTKRVYERSSLRRYNKRRNAKRKAKYRSQKSLLICERCGFIPKHQNQMDIHHKDRNHLNNDPINLEVLCANCHRLEHANKE